MIVVAVVAVFVLRFVSLVVVVAVAFVVVLPVDVFPLAVAAVVVAPRSVVAFVAVVLQAVVVVVVPVDDEVAVQSCRHLVTESSADRQVLRFSDVEGNPGMLRLQALCHLSIKNKNLIFVYSKSLLIEIQFYYSAPT